LLSPSIFPVPSLGFPIGSDKKGSDTTSKRKALRLQVTSENSIMNKKRVGM